MILKYCGPCADYSKHGYVKLHVSLSREDLLPDENGSFCYVHLRELISKFDTGSMKK
jgi:hypothetical protein